MILTSYEVVYVMMNMFRIYIIYRFMDIFYNKSKVTVKEFFLYLFYFLVNTVAYLFLNIPIVNMLTNIVGLFLLTFLYSVSIKKNILVVLLITTLGISIETVFSVIDGYQTVQLFNEFGYVDIWCQFATQLFTFLVMLLMKGYQNFRKDVIVPNTYWGTVIAIPIASSMIVLMLINNGIVRMNDFIICIAILVWVSKLKIKHSLYSQLLTKFVNRPHTNAFLPIYRLLYWLSFRLLPHLGRTSPVCVDYVSSTF